MRKKVICIIMVLTPVSLYTILYCRKKIVKAKLYYSGKFEDYLSESLAGFNAEAAAKLDTLTNKCIKYLFYRYNDSLVFAGIEREFIVHTKVSADEVVLQNIKSRDWQYLVENIIEKAETKV